MSDREKLDQEVKTYVTKTTAEVLRGIAHERGDGVKITQLVREAIRDYIAANTKTKRKEK
jgi:hypothetical protein